MSDGDTKAGLKLFGCLALGWAALSWLALPAQAAAEPARRAAAPSPRPTAGCRRSATTVAAPTPMTIATINSPADDAAYQGGFRKVLEVTRLLHDEGIQLLPGTDDATGFALLSMTCYLLYRRQDRRRLPRLRRQRVQVG